MLFQLIRYALLKFIFPLGVYFMLKSGISYDLTF